MRILCEYCGVVELVKRRALDPKVVGSKPTPAAKNAHRWAISCPVGPAL